MFFRSYEKKVLRDTTRQMPNFMVCLGPGCNSGQIHEGGDAQPIMTCTACQFQSCWTHQMPWHSGQTCDEYEVERKERVAQEAASMQILDETIKVCPNTKCGLHVVKISDGYHMTCKPLILLQIILLIFQGDKCKFEFCWTCLAPYRPIRQRGNRFHAAGCKYYSSNLPNADPDIGIALEAPFRHAYPAPPSPTVNAFTAATLNVSHNFEALTVIEAIPSSPAYPVHPPLPTANPSISATAEPRFPTTGP
jgi:hypothetical protein